MSTSIRRDKGRSCVYDAYFVSNEQCGVIFQAGVEIRKRALHMGKGWYEGTTASKVCSGQDITQLN